MSGDTAIAHPTLEERVQEGKYARKETPRSSIADWRPAPDRPDPVDTLDAQNATREPDLVPVRHGRMMVSPFTFYRGSARVMAEDLRTIPRAGLDVQLCGDAHLSNFGVFASPERALLFDLNDFDETLPGPFEYDVARLSVSFVVAARNNGFIGADQTAAARAATTAYRNAMAEFAGMRTLDVWYSRLDADRLLERAAAIAGPDPAIKRGRKSIRKAHARNSMHALSRLTEIVDGAPRIVSAPPVVVRSEEVAEIYGQTPEFVDEQVHTMLRAYRDSLVGNRRRLLERFEYIEFARKVVGVGSVGTRAWIVLLRGRDNGDPLFLQVKEATRSVLEDHLPASQFEQPGQRVVEGQRLMQAASDVFLGWTTGIEEDRYYYWRQLKDMKGSALVDEMDPRGLSFYAEACGWTLARAHARSGDPVAIASYLGAKSRFDQAMTTFAVTYADQNERDYARFVSAVREGRLEAREGV